MNPARNGGRISTKAANDLSPTDRLVRFGRVLKIETITRRLHPLAGRETVSVKHEAGVVDYLPSHEVEIAGPLALRFGGWGRDGKLTYSNLVLAVRDIADASGKWCALRDSEGFGASDAPIVVVVNTITGEQVAKISYNGRAWGIDGVEISFDGRKTAAHRDGSRVKNPNASQVAAFFGAPVKNVKAQYAKNAAQLRQLAKQAGSGQCRGKTAAEWLRLAQIAEDKSK